MPNPVVTTADITSLVIRNDEYLKETINATGAIEMAQYTLLGRITTGGKLREYLAGSGDGSEVPVAILMEALSFAGAGDQTSRVLLRGDVRADLLIKHTAGGALTPAERDQLRTMGIFALEREQLYTVA